MISDYLPKVVGSWRILLVSCSGDEGCFGDEDAFFLGGEGGG